MLMFGCFFQALDIISEVGDLLVLKYSKLKQVPFSEDEPTFRKRLNVMLLIINIIIFNNHSFIVHFFIPPVVSPSDIRTFPSRRSSAKPSEIYEELVCLPAHEIAYFSRCVDDHRNPWHHSPATRSFLWLLCYLSSDLPFPKNTLRIYFFASQEVAFFVVLVMFVAWLYDCPMCWQEEPSDCDPFCISLLGIFLDDFFHVFFFVIICRLFNFSSYYCFPVI